MKIIKRSGKEVAFDVDRIIAAIMKAEGIIYESRELSGSAQEKFHRYLQIMEEIDWPAYVNGDTIFREIVVEEYEQSGTDGVIPLIYDYYGPGYLLDLEDQLSASEVIKTDRFPILKEAFLLHHLGYFYGSVSILIPQIYGIISDINDYLNLLNEDYDPDTRRLLHERYRFEKNSEISQIMTAVIEGEGIDDEREGYGYLANYLRFRIFNGDLSTKSAEHNPSRHMICHGRQLNFGTKEHSLKTIICIDALATIADMITEDIKNGRPWIK